MEFKKIFALFFLCFPAGMGAFGQQTISLTLEETIRLAQEQSIDAMIVRNAFLGNYWSFRSHRAELLPSLNFSAGIANFDRSQRALQDAGTGEIYYRTNYNMNNSATVSIDQQVAATGGTLSLASSLNRLDQYRPVRDITYYSQPVTLSYLQPLFTYNRLRWDKKIEPEKFERSKREYLESMEEVTLKAVRYFYSLATAQLNYDIAVGNYSQMKTMYGIAARRHEQTGSVTRSELLQLELRMVNDSLSISTRENDYKARLMEFRSFLGYNDKADLQLDRTEQVPELRMEVGFVLEKTLENGSFRIDQEISRLESDRSVAQARANRGVSVSVSTQFGLSNNAGKLPAAYSDLLNHEIFGINLRVPIVDWGMGKGRVKMAQTQQKITLAHLEQALTDLEQNVYLEVVQFNAQRDKLRMARRANRIAEERYELTVKDFAAGMISVTDLNTAQSEKDAANMSYLTELSNFWIYYFSIRKMTLYDFGTNTDISAEYDKLLE
ncbi:MAG: TolC family protein [Culturomica sp.]|nr:TolC family protein [Culturomica sp.]